ncbi:hypothetical protein MPLDJ20_130017 [Mesorhizobium plurifarium]|uniref:Uncharacterized protein n=1 Tax=Mesorhizobium plurifarium TaxID=69974 RepID=A0A090EIN4_MESPL|nr:hypothetical protein MPLDJ20_130017 [Mesorhizobium plurifarium]
MVGLSQRIRLARGLKTPVLPIPRPPNRTKSRTKGNGKKSYRHACSNSITVGSNNYMRGNRYVSTRPPRVSGW